MRSQFDRYAHFRSFLVVIVCVFVYARENKELAEKFITLVQYLLCMHHENVVQHILGIATYFGFRLLLLLSS